MSRNISGARMICSAMRRQGRDSDCSSTRSGTTRRLLMRWPSIAISAGSSVSAAAMVTIGMRMPARPNDRTNGTGTSSSTPRPMPTVTPENTTARTAVRIVTATASATSRPAVELLAEPVHDQQRVVDRDAEADQRHDVRREHRHVGDVRQREHDRQDDRDHEQRQQQRHDARPRGCRAPRTSTISDSAPATSSARTRSPRSAGFIFELHDGPARHQHRERNAATASATRRASGTLACASSWSSNGMVM